MIAPAALWRRTIGAWDRFWFGDESPVTLAVCRLIYYSAILWVISDPSIEAYAMGPPTTLPPEYHFPFHVFKFLPVASPETLSVLWRVLEAAVLAAAIGFMTRLAAVVAAGSLFYLFGLTSCYGKTFFIMGIPVAILCLLAVARTGDALSVDRLIRRRWRWWPFSRVDARPGPSYRWSLQLLRLYIVLVLFMSGVTKLVTSGFAWAFSDNLATVIAAGGTDQPCIVSVAHSAAFNQWLAEHTLLVQLMAFGVLVLEISAPIALIATGAARYLLLIAYLAMHVAIKYLLGVDFILFEFGYAFFLPWDRIVAAVTRRLPGQRSHQ